MKVFLRRLLLPPKLKRRIRDPRAPFSRVPWRERPVYALSLGSRRPAP